MRYYSEITKHGIELWYLLNFGEALMKDGISRVLNGKVE